MNPIRFDFRQTKFITSAPDIRALPNDDGIEIAFAGRSNAGKSSALNRLTDHKNLARTSKTPGRTQLINLFEVDEQHRLVDLPGYGFAKVPLEVKHKWQKALGEYLQKRTSLKGLVVVMDIRHPLKELDQQVIQWAVDSDLPVIALLTKADKLKQGARKEMSNKVSEACLAFCGDVSVITFSALNGLGLDQLRSALNQWYTGTTAAQPIDDH